MSVPAIAVVGVGHMGGLHAQKLAQLAAEGAIRFAGVCDVDPARARQVAEPLGAPLLASLAEVCESAQDRVAVHGFALQRLLVIEEPENLELDSGFSQDVQEQLRLLPGAEHQDSGHEPGLVRAHWTYVICFWIRAPSMGTLARICAILAPAPASSCPG